MIRFLSILAIFFAVPFPASADMIRPESARSDTVKALKFIQKDRWREARKIIAETKDPLAIRIYHWLLYRQNPHNTSFVGLAQFIRKNPHWPDLYFLRREAEQNFPPQSDRNIVAWFDDFKPLTTKGTDLYLSSLMATGRKDKVSAFLEDWWANILLPPRDQKFIYRKYGRFLNRKAHLRRLDTLLFSRHYTNARAIARLLGNDYVKLTEARIALTARKNAVNSYINRVPDHLLDDPGLMYERLNWRRAHDLNDGAIEILNKAQSLEYVPNRDSWWRERHIVIRRLIEEEEYGRAYRLASRHIQKDGFSLAQAEWMAGFLALRFLNKPAEAQAHFIRLYDSVSMPISKARGAYWTARATQALGHPQKATQWYKKAAKYRTTYYGQMAAAELSLGGNAPDIAPPELTGWNIKRFQDDEFIQAVHIFHEAGMSDEASAFLNAFVGKLQTPEAYRFAADLALEMNHYHDAVRISKNATKKGLFLTTHSYPTITANLREIDLEWALVHALIRQESQFDKKARSPSGALGLMQLMPATARETARKLGIRHSKDWLTADPAHNITLGTSYLGRLLDAFEGSYPLAVAAYNAGPRRVRQWLKTFGDPRRGEIDIIDWIELIPVYETRNYVQRVIEGTYVYRLRLHDVQKMPNIVINMATPQNLQNL